MTQEILAGHFAIRGAIGAGSFSTVYRAFDERLDSDVVVKVLAENHSLNPEVRERFIGEGRALRRVHSPHVVTVYDIGESERQQPFLVLEYADRGTLAQRVHRRRAQGWTADAADLLTVARSLASALTSIHAVGLVHRDLTPDNVLILSSPVDGEAGVAASAEHGLIGSDERLLLADFGLGKDLVLNSGLTVAAGTSGFRPPEQRAPGLVDARADLWALSALLGWLNEGADLPTLRTVLQRGLADDPDRRQPDAATWLYEIETALAPPPPGAPATSSAPAPPAFDPNATVRSASEPEVTGSKPPRERSKTTPRMDQKHPANGLKPPRERSKSTPRTAWLVGLLAVALVALGFAGGMAVRGDSGPSDSTSTASIEISGPTTVSVGEPVTFTASTAGVAGWVWALPTGTFQVGVETVTLTPTTPGTARVELTALDGEGRLLRSVHEFRVE